MQNISTIRLLRLVRGLKLHEVSQKTGISIAKLSFIERGLLPVKKSDMEKISAVVGMTLNNSDDENQVE
jgi:transcriptional regulator with XRE-family HTH domain